jgi:4-diphosphocytidyl-2-C-methyl-D-erythritol kinase
MKTIKSYAKINLFLDIVDIYKNGYHKINSLICETDLYDEISYRENALGEIRVFDESNVLPKDNILTKAANLFLSTISHNKIGVDFHIVKNIPIGGGMGGGSSNGAAVLKALNKIYETQQKKKKLEKLALKIGSDVPFFIRGGLQKVTGTGNILKKLELNIKPEITIVLTFPNVSVDTSKAYKIIDDYNLAKKEYKNIIKYKNIISGFLSNDFNKIVSNTYNKFESVIFKEYPEIENIYNLIKTTNPLTLFMSGSGSTLVSMFALNEEADKSIDVLYNNGIKAVKTKLLIMPNS